MVRRMELVAFDTYNEYTERTAFTDYWNRRREYQEAMDTGSIKKKYITHFRLFNFIEIIYFWTSGAPVKSNESEFDANFESDYRTST